MAKTPDQNDLQTALRLISALSDTFQCHDTVSEEFAVAAFVDDRAAFWRTSGYSNQAAGNLCDAANMVGLEAALAERHGRNPNAMGAAAPLYLIACLVPLNGTARAELHRCREAEMAKRDLAFVKTHLAPLSPREMADAD